MKSTLKTEIIQEYHLDSSHSIAKVLPLGADDFVVLTYQSGNPTLNVHGSYERKLDLPNPKRHHELNGFCSLFKYKEGFGLAERFGKLSLCANLKGDPKKVQTSEPYSSQGPSQPFLSAITYRDFDDSFVVGIEDELSYFFPAKYWTSMKLKNKKALGFNLSQLNPVLDELRTLEINQYPATSRNYAEGEWLSIQALGADEHRLLLHTNGGASTRTKSGPDFEFSIISEFDRNLRFIDNHMVEEGKVFFSADKKCFTVLSRNNKKLLVYNTDHFQVEFEISLTPKQNLGAAKPKYLSVDIWKDNLYLYGKDFLNICKILK